MSVKLVLRSDGLVCLEIENNVPNEAEKKMIDELIAPEGYIMAQTFNKLKTLGSYVVDINQANITTTSKPQVKPEDVEDKPKYEKCPVCGRDTVSTKTVKKEGANKGLKFKSCFNTKTKEGKDLPKVPKGAQWSKGYACTYFEWL
jgi:formate dehydrogenase maturation protein FdhE